MIASTIGALGFTKDARVRMLGVTGATRSKFVPELPTLAEGGAEAGLRLRFLDRAARARRHPEGPRSSS